MHTMNGEARPGILLVDDDITSIHALSKALQGMGSLHFAKGGHEALRVARSEAIDLILLDAEMPLMSGFEVHDVLKADTELSHIPVIFVTSHSDQDIEQAGMAMGAADFIAKPIRPAIVAARAATQIRLKRAADELRALALIDSLTGLANRRAFDAALAREWARSQRCGEPLSVILLDIDHFKGYNAHHGRRRGDECLVKLAQVLSSSLKLPADMTARYGGGSFVVMMPCTDGAGAMEIGRRIIGQVTGLCMAHGAVGAGPFVTVSIGVSSHDEECDNWISDGCSTRVSEPIAVCAADLVEAASLALAQTKQICRGDECFVSIYRAVAERMADQPMV